MNLKMLLILLLLTSSLFSIETEFDQMTPSDRNGVWTLDNTKDPSLSARLDCMSFFHKLDFIYNPTGDVLEQVLSASECEYMFNKISSCIDSEGYVCIETDDVFQDNCFCKK